MILELPWPDSRLSPNARKDRRGISNVRKTARQIGYVYALKSGRGEFKDAKSIHADITFYPPDDRRRDLDNMFASLKSQIDGIASAIGVDDYFWSFSIRRAEKKKGGLVKLELTECQQ